MSIWKELTHPTTFAGQFDTVGELAPSVERAARPNGPLAVVNKKESVIGPGVVIEGTIEGDDDLRVAGKVKGNISLRGNLAVEPGARIDGEIRAGNVALGGAVEGNIQASATVKLLETGQLVGDLKARNLVAALGSRMHGRVEFGWDEPRMRPAEKAIQSDAHEKEVVGPPKSA